MNGVVFRPGGFDGTGKREDVIAIEAILRGGGGGVPFLARFDGFASVVADERPWIGNVRRAANVLEAPMEGLDAAVVVGSPTAMLVAANFALEPVHKGSCQLLVYSCSFGKEKFD